MKNQNAYILASLFSLLLVACGEPQVAEPEEPVETPPATSVGTPAPATSAATAANPPPVSLHELMRDVIEPNAQRVWRSVSYIATPGGVEETMPVNDMDWEGLHQSAIILLESAHGLTLEGREIGADYDLVRQDFQYSAAEITELRTQNRDDWNAIAEGMLNMTREVLDAIDRRDIFALTETGADLNRACEACHAAYWYRP